MCCTFRTPSLTPFLAMPRLKSKFAQYKSSFMLFYLCIRALRGADLRSTQRPSRLACAAWCLAQSSHATQASVCACLCVCVSLSKTDIRIVSCLRPKMKDAPFAICLFDCQAETLQLFTHQKGLVLTSEASLRA